MKFGVKTRKRLPKLKAVFEFKFLNIMKKAVSKNYFDIFMNTLLMIWCISTSHGIYTFRWIKQKPNEVEKNLKA